MRGTAIKQLQYPDPSEPAQRAAALLHIFPSEKNKQQIINIVKRYPPALDVSVEEVLQNIDALAATLGVTRTKALAAVAIAPHLVRYLPETLRGKVNGIAAFTGV